MSSDDHNEGKAPHLQCVNVQCRSENVVLKGESVAHATNGQDIRQPHYQCRECGTVWSPDQTEWWAGYGG